MKKIKLGEVRGHTLKTLSSNTFNSGQLELDEDQIGGNSFGWVGSEGVSKDFAPSTGEDTMSPVKCRSASKGKHRTAFEGVNDFQERLQVDAHGQSRPKDKLKVLLGNSLSKLQTTHENETPKAAFPKLKKMKSFSEESYEESKGYLDLKFGLPLPGRFNQLCKLVSTLDQTVNYFKMKNKMLVYDELKTSIEANIKV